MSDEHNQDFQELSEKVEQLIGQKRQLDQLLSRTFLEDKTGFNYANIIKAHKDKTLCEDWDRYFFGDLRCDEDLSSKASKEAFQSPEPIQRTFSLSCPGAPKKRRREPLRLRVEQVFVSDFELPDWVTSEPLEELEGRLNFQYASVWEKDGSDLRLAIEDPFIEVSYDESATRRQNLTCVSNTVKEIKRILPCE